MMHDTPLATSSPIRSRIKQMGRRKAKSSRRSVSLLDVSVIDANPDVSSQISESNETLASGYRDSGYVRSEASSSLEDDDSKASKELVEELKFKDVLICELQESNRGLRMRCADAENKIWRLRVKCQSHCACCQVKEVAPSPTDSAGEDKDEALSTLSGKYNSLNQDLFRFKRPHPFSVSSNDLNLSKGHDRLTSTRDRLANSFSVRENESQLPSPAKPLSRSKSSGTIGTKALAHRSSRRADDQAAEKLFALKVQQWQKENSARLSPTDEMSVDRLVPKSPQAADVSCEPLHLQMNSHTPLPHRTSKHDRAFGGFDAGEGETSLLSVISERDTSLEVDPRRALRSPADVSSTDSLLHSAAFADVTKRKNAAYGAEHRVSKASNSLEHPSSSLYISDPGFHAGGQQTTLKTPIGPGPATSDWVNSKFTEWVSGPPGSGERFARNEQLAASEQPCGHCKCTQPSPVIIIPTGCCSCCKMATIQTASSTLHHSSEATPGTPQNQDPRQVKFDASTDSSDLHPIFEIKSKSSSASGKLGFSAPSESKSKTEEGTMCGNPSSDRGCKCSPICSGLTIPLASRLDAKAEYKRKIEEGMKKFALDARAETESLSFQPWTSPNSAEMSPLMKRLAESSHYVNQMAIAINRIATRFHHITGTPNPINPSP